MATINEDLLDALVRHQIYLLRFSGSLRNKIIKLLNETEDDLEAEIRRRLARSAEGATSANLKRAELLVAAIKKLRLKAWSQVTDTWVEELTDLAKQEPAFLAGLYKTLAPVTLDLLLPTAETLAALVRARPFQGRVLREWAKSVAAADIRRIEDQIKIGLVQGQTPAELARRVVGTGVLGGSDGVTATTRRNVEAITRTAVNAYSNAAKREFYKANAGLFDEELYVATLDERTTRICSSLDGERFPVGKGPIPPLHFNCRSLRVALFDGQVLGSRPMKSITERETVREYQRANGLAVTGRRADLPRGHKGTYDSYARGRIREMTGQVPASTTYQEFLSRQSRSFQDDVLGPTRARLFRTGRLDLKKFVNRAGDELTLAELARKHADVFRQAGLDPEDFLD
jgi:SPP1 gp7 family putative phage head morphogenesis protein